MSVVSSVPFLGVPGYNSSCGIYAIDIGFFVVMAVINAVVTRHFDYICMITLIGMTCSAVACYYTCTGSLNRLVSVCAYACRLLKYSAMVFAILRVVFAISSGSYMSIVLFVPIVKHILLCMSCLWTSGVYVI